MSYLMFVKKEKDFQFVCSAAKSWVHYRCHLVHVAVNPCLRQTGSRGAVELVNERLKRHSFCNLSELIRRPEDATVMTVDLQPSSVKRHR